MKLLETIAIPGLIIFIGWPLMQKYIVPHIPDLTKHGYSDYYDYGY